MYYIMSASCLFDNKTVTIDQLAEEWPDSTVLVCRRETSPGKASRIFVSGAGKGYEENFALGDTISRRYTQDTGNGHTNKNKKLVIENLITIEDGKVVDTGNGFGMTIKRRSWVMK